MSVTLEIRNLTKRFDCDAAVDNLSISLQQGDFLSLLGPSGCGKSTTLGMIAGLVEPDSGEIIVDGKLMNNVPPEGRRVGLVFQDYAIFTALSVRENLAFGLAVNGLSRSRRRATVDSFAEKFDLFPLLDRRGATLNMSEMQRVAMGRALITNPHLLLLDEPMSNLDAGMRSVLRGELKLLQRKHQQTVLYVTHDQVEALSMSDRIAIMRAGKLLQVGTPEEIYRRPANRFVAEFVGDPPINVFPCDVERVGAGLKLSTFGHSIGFGKADELEGGRHLVAVRPHDLHAVKGARRGYAAVRVRFVENLGVEHILHCEYGHDLLRAAVSPGFASVGEVIYVAFDLERIHVIDRTSEQVIPTDIPECS